MKASGLNIKRVYLCSVDEKTLKSKKQQAKTVFFSITWKTVHRKIKTDQCKKILWIILNKNSHMHFCFACQFLINSPSKLRMSFVLAARTLSIAHISRWGGFSVKIYMTRIEQRISNIVFWIIVWMYVRMHLVISQIRF